MEIMNSFEEYLRDTYNVVFDENKNITSFGKLDAKELARRAKLLDFLSIDLNKTPPAQREQLKLNMEDYNRVFGTRYGELKDIIEGARKEAKDIVSQVNLAKLYEEKEHASHLFGEQKAQIDRLLDEVTLQIREAIKLANREVVNYSANGAIVTYCQNDQNTMKYFDKNRFNENTKRAREMALGILVGLGDFKEVKKQWDRNYLTEDELSVLDKHLNELAKFTCSDGRPWNGGLGEIIKFGLSAEDYKAIAKLHISAGTLSSSMLSASMFVPCKKVINERNIPKETVDAMAKENLSSAHFAKFAEISALPFWQKIITRQSLFDKIAKEVDNVFGSENKITYVVGTVAQNTGAHYQSSSKDLDCCGLEQGHVVVGNRIFCGKDFLFLVELLVHERNHAEQSYDAKKGEKLMDLTEKNYRHPSMYGWDLYHTMANEIDSYDVEFKTREFVKKFGHEKAEPEALKETLERELKRDVDRLNYHGQRTGTLSTRKEEKKKKELAFKTGVLKKMSGGAAMS